MKEIELQLDTGLPFCHRGFVGETVVWVRAPITMNDQDSDGTVLGTELERKQALM